ncbi:MAG: beta-ketoacyl synthase N-terminal-like domain-containing protein [Planctomycetota bacterium]|nr:beta-ketoacyl synthase N-terminal-like domain-containing protein [Planctomycetota bacterium]
MTSPRPSSKQSIAVTGTGLATCLGLDLASTWRGVCESRLGMRPLAAMEQPSLPGKDGGEVPELPHDFAPGRSREARYLAWVILAALEDAKLRDTAPAARGRWCVVMGSTLHGMPAGGRFFRSGDPAFLDAFLSASVLAQAIDVVGVGGLAVTTCSACASGLSSVALGSTLLQAGEADVVIAGGYDPLSEYSYGGFNSLRLMSSAPVLPFGRDRQGLRLGEGYAAVILEREDDARRRGGRVAARVLAYGESADAHHLTQPHPEGAGAARAIAGAMIEGGITPGDVDLIGAHATATPDNDGAEYLALRSAFGDRLPEVPCVAFKSHLGHTLGAAGAVELVLSLAAMESGLVPPTRNVTRESLAYPDLRLQLGAPHAGDIRRTVNVSLGFGGSNACVVIERGDVQAPAAVARGRAVERPLEEVFITGVGVVAPGAPGVVGNEAFVERVSRPDASPLRAV